MCKGRRNGPSSACTAQGEAFSMLDGSMLTKPEDRPCYVAHCDLCGRDEYTDETELDAAREVMRMGGWLEVARVGAGVDRWHWWCRTCRPKTPSSLGRSTPGDGPPSSE